MKKQILEVQNYFLNKITACQFDSVEMDYKTDGWAEFKVIIDGCRFNFSIHHGMSLFCGHGSDFKIDVPFDRLSNLIALIEGEKESLKDAKIEKLKLELQELENHNYNV